MHSNRSQIEFPSSWGGVSEDQTAVVGVVVVGVRGRQSALHPHQLAAQLPEQPRDVPVVLGAHFNVVQLPGLLDLQHDSHSGRLGRTDLVGDVEPQLAPLGGVWEGEEVGLVGHHQDGQVGQAPGHDDLIPARIS